VGLGPCRPNQGARRGDYKQIPPSPLLESQVNPYWPQSWPAIVLIGKPDLLGWAGCSPPTSWQIYRCGHSRCSLPWSFSQGEAHPGTPRTSARRVRLGGPLRPGGLLRWARPPEQEGLTADGCWRWPGGGEAVGFSPARICNLKVGLVRCAPGCRRGGRGMRGRGLPSFFAALAPSSLMTSRWALARWRSIKGAVGRGGHRIKLKPGSRPRPTSLEGGEARNHEDQVSEGKRRAGRTPGS